MNSQMRVPLVSWVGVIYLLAGQHTHTQTAHVTDQFLEQITSPDEKAPTAFRWLPVKILDVPHMFAHRLLF